jgi:hypothetical protein
MRRSSATLPLCSITRGTDKQAEAERESHRRSQWPTGIDRRRDLVPGPNVSNGVEARLYSDRDYGYRESREVPYGCA